MGGGSGRHAELAAELGEWWEDLWQRHIGSRVVLVKVPARWGRSTVLDCFAAGITGHEDAPVTLTVRVSGQDLRGETIGIQAEKLRACLAGAARRHRVAELLGLDELSGQVGLGLGVGGFFFSGLTAGVSFLLAGLVVGAAGKAWDGSPAGQDGALARTARAVAAVSVSAPVVVIIDDADCLDGGLAVTLVENLTGRCDGQVLIIAAVDLGSALATALTTRVRYGLTEGLVYVAEADPDMGFESRLELARQLCPSLPDAAARRVAQRTTTFAEVFSVAAAPRLAEIGQGEDEGGVLGVVDAAVNARLARPKPSPEATVIAWAGGLVHARQTDRARGILGATRDENDPGVRRWESLERLADPADSRLAGLVDADLAARDRHAMAAAFLDEALTITQAPGTSLIDKVAALQATHRVRADLAAAGRELPRAQCELVATLEALGDHIAALQVATEALTEWPTEGEHQAERDVLTAAVIRLSRATPQAFSGPLAEQLIDEAVAGGAAAGLEARIWAAIVLLDTSGQHDTAQALAEQITADLETRRDLGPYGDRWRLLLAYHTGRAGLPGLTARLLTPLITSSDPARQDAADVVLRAAGGPGADIRLQNILLEAELGTLPPEADDDRLRIHHALAENHGHLGDYQQALAHGQHELGLRTHIQGPHHPGTLVTRHDIAFWTGKCGDAAGALRLCRDLLPDMEQVLGPHHPYTLATRGNIAAFTGECGDAAGALRLYRDLLPDEERVLGPRHRSTLATRDNIARWTGECGDAAGALRLYRDLLPDEERVLGPRHPSTLTARDNIASLTGRCGDAAGALRLCRDLLPDEERALGPRHPSTLATRHDIAFWTGQCGDAAGALRLCRDLLPDMERALGPRHPRTLATRGNIASWTGQCGDTAGALRLCQNLLPDMEQALGPRHPGTLATRGNIAFWTGKCGDAAGALRLCQDLLPDEERVLGPHHPYTLATRHNIASLTGEGGNGR
jgi:tetratricopeptide (TPR) repeat protein